MKKEIGLVFQGGGALGAYEVGVYKALKENHIEPNIISRVSIGAINAGIIVANKDDEIEGLRNFWGEMTVTVPPFLLNLWRSMWSISGNLNLYIPRMDYYQAYKWTHFYDVNPLRKNLEKYIDFKKIPKSPTKLFISAVDVTSGELRIVGNNEITLDHIIASGSLPPFFPWTFVDGNYYWAGGLFNNTPSSSIIDKFDEDTEDRTIVIAEIFSRKSENLPQNINEVYDRVYRIIFSNKMEADIRACECLNDCLKTIYELQEALSSVDKSKAETLIEKFRFKNRIRPHCSILVDIIRITPLRPEDTFATFDCSEYAIQGRIEYGYDDAVKKLEEEMINKEISKMAKDPLCGMEIDEKKAAGKSEDKDKIYYFCSDACKSTFDKNPKKYLKKKNTKIKKL